MELGEVLFYFRQAKAHYEQLADAHASQPSGDGKVVESESWAKQDDEDYDEDEDVSVDSLIDE